MIVAEVPAPFGMEAVVALTGAYTATEPTTPQVRCELGFTSLGNGFTGTLSFNASMTIVKAGSLG